MLRRAGPRLSLCKHASPARARPLHCVRSTSVQYADPGFFTPSSSSSSSSSRPPPQPGNGRGGGSPRRERVSDQEYNIRVGRAYDLLQATIPDFMRTGLVDYHHDHQPHPSRLTLLDIFTFRALRADSNSSSSSSSEVTGKDGEEDEQVYDLGIHFRFCPAPPPSSLSTQRSEPGLTDEEVASLSFSGRSLYFASAHILRHSLNAVFADTRVEVKKIRLESKGERPRVEDVLHLRLDFSGHWRVTGQEQKYTLIFRYDFDSETGRIVRHTVERVEPAIGRKLWIGLATVWQRLIGHEPAPVPSACHMHIHKEGPMESSSRDQLQGETRAGMRS